VKRILKVAVAILVLLLVALAVPVVLKVRATPPIREDVRLDGVQVVKDSFVAVYLVDLAPGEVALVDGGNDPTGKPILDALARRGLGADAVKAILLTHADSDHLAAVGRFPRATLMALADEVPRVEGRVGVGPGEVVPSPWRGKLKVGRALADGETVEFGGTPIRVFALPGHTDGSAAYLARGVLFMGDSAAATPSGALEHGWWFANKDTAREDRSLAALAARLRPLSAEVKAIAPAHSVVLTTGLRPLEELAARR
jgi:glyoxylase-like metal-dependent hydrolase (beta-lactamase superfamily II)